MDKYPISEIEIENYKLFKHFKAKGFGRVNLIGGKNNVGKTAFMEACFLSSELDKSWMDFLSALFTVENSREILVKLDQKVVFDILKKYSPMSLLSSFKNRVELKFENGKFTFTVTNKEETLDFDIIQNSIKILPNFITNSNINCLQIITKEKLMNILFDGVKKSRNRDKLNSFLNTFDKDIIEVDIIENSFKLYSNNRNEWMDIADFGDGIKCYLTYPSAIWSFKDRAIFIDEIENGIHYTNFDKLWEIILTLSKEQSVQVFATTHSKECIESYARVAKKLKDKEITFLELGKDTQNKVSTMIYPYDWFMDAIEQKQEVRGW